MFVLHVHIEHKDTAEKAYFILTQVRVRSFPMITVLISVCIIVAPVSLSVFHCCSKLIHSTGGGSCRESLQAAQQKLLHLTVGDREYGKR